MILALALLLLTTLASPTYGDSAPTETPSAPTPTATAGPALFVPENPADATTLHQLEGLLGSRGRVRDFTRFTTERNEPAMFVLYVKGAEVEDSGCSDDWFCGCDVLGYTSVRGEYSVALVIAGQLINEVSLGVELLTLVNTHANNHGMWGQDDYPGGDPRNDAPREWTKLINLRDYNEDGHAWEFRVVQEGGSCGDHETMLVGYSAKQRRVILYPIVTGKESENIHDNFFPYPEAPAAATIRYGYACGDHRNGDDLLREQTFEYNSQVEAWVLSRQAVSPCLSEDGEDGKDGSARPSATPTGVQIHLGSAPDAEIVVPPPPASDQGLTTSPAPPVRSLDQIRAEYGEVMAQLPSGEYARSILDSSCPSPEYNESRARPWRDLVNRGWSLVGEWAAAYLNAHPAASGDELGAAIGQLSFRHARSDIEMLEDTHPGGPKLGDSRYETLKLEASAVRLRDGRDAAYVIAPHARGAGTFFIVAHTPEHGYRLAWNVADVAAARADPRVSGEIGSWAFLGVGSGLVGMSGEVHPLPQKRTGEPRFYVDAVATAYMGGTYPKQLSIWEWNGQEPVAEFIEAFAVTGDTPPMTRKDDVLSIPIKEDLDVLGFCGMCQEPPGLWTVRITPDGVEDLGHRITDPLYPLIADLLERSGDGKDVSDIAAPQVATALRTSFVESNHTANSAACPLLFDVNGWTVTHGPESDHLFATLDPEACDFSGPGQLDLTITYREGKPYVAAGTIGP